MDKGMMNEFGALRGKGGVKVTGSLDVRRVQQHSFLFLVDGDLGIANNGCAGFYFLESDDFACPWYHGIPHFLGFPLVGMTATGEAWKGDCKSKCMQPGVL
jgi:hypothetical protein